jgi:protein-S-isoprenylcysteine O-methyltransferase Ste14
MDEPQADNPGVIAPPPLIYLAALALGFVLDYLFPVSLLARTTQLVAGGVLMVAGLALAIAAVRLFSRAGTGVPTHRPVTALVTGGIYRFSRNPIYVGMTVLSAGIAVAADNPWLLALLVPTLAVMNYGVIAREERFLEAKFGDDYRRYKASVRRWL